MVNVIENVINVIAKDVVNGSHNIISDIFLKLSLNFEMVWHCKSHYFLQDLRHLSL